MQLVALIKIKRLVGAQKVGFALRWGEIKGAGVLPKEKTRKNGRTKGEFSVVQPNGRLAEGGDVIGNSSPVRCSQTLRCSLCSDSTNG